MDSRKIPVPLSAFRSPLAPIAAWLYAAASLAGLAGALLLTFPSGQAAVAKDLILSGITEGEALVTWQIIFYTIGIAAFVCPGMMGAGLLTVLRGPRHRGFSVLYHGFRWLEAAVKGTGILALGLLLFRLCRYILRCLRINGGSYLIYTMVLSEAIMVAQAGLLYTLLRRFLESAWGCAASIGYTLSSGNLDEKTIPGFAITGFWGLGIANLVLAADRLLTLTIVDAFPQDYYRILVTREPVQLFTGAALLLGGIASVALGFYLRRFKKIAEQFLYADRKKRMGSPVR